MRSSSEKLLWHVLPFISYSCFSFSHFLLLFSAFPIFYFHLNTSPNGSGFGKHCQGWRIPGCFLSCSILSVTESKINVQCSFLSPSRWSFHKGLVEMVVTQSWEGSQGLSFLSKIRSMRDSRRSMYNAYQRLSAALGYLLRWGETVENVGN